MSSFKDDVLYYLGKNPSYEVPFDIFEGEEEKEEKDEKEEEDTCPDCGKKSSECECEKDDEKKSSKSTETAGGDDGDDGYHYSVATNGSDETAKELINRLNGLLEAAKGKKTSTPEEKEMLAYITSKISKNSSVKTSLPGEFNKVTQNKGASENSPDLKDDHTNGRNGSCQTEGIFNY